MKPKPTDGIPWETRTARSNMKTRKVALVTGSATGIGRAAAIRFAQEGLAVALNYSRSHTDAEETLAAVKSHGVPAILCQANVADRPAGKKLNAHCHHEP